MDVNFITFHLNLKLLEKFFIQLDDNVNTLTQQLKAKKNKMSFVEKNFVENEIIVIEIKISSETTCSLPDEVREACRSLLEHWKNRSKRFDMASENKQLES